MSLRKIGTVEPAPVEVESTSEDLAKTARQRWTEDDDRRLADENEETDEGR
jgi:hypothetical protein